MRNADKKKLFETMLNARQGRDPNIMQITDHDLQ